MYVETGVGGKAGFCAAIERLVAERHLRMHTEQSGHLPVTGLPAAADIAQVFLDALPLGVAVGYFVAKTPTQAHITERLLDAIEAALPAGRRGMMVDDRRTALARSIHEGKQRRVVNVVGVQRLVELPPEFSENFLEVRRRCSGRCESPGKGRIQVMVRVDEGRHHHVTAGIDLPVGVDSGRDLSDRDNAAVFDVNTAVVDTAILLIEGDKMGIAYEQ